MKSTATTETPIVGLLPVMDPRIDPDLERKILGYLNLEEKLRSLDVEVIWPGRAGPFRARKTPSPR